MPGWLWYIVVPLLAVAGLVLLLFVFCFLVKLTTFSILRGREMFEQTQRRRSKDGEFKS